jgi:hypothetical protein
LNVRRTEIQIKVDEIDLKQRTFLPSRRKEERKGGREEGRERGRREEGREEERKKGR